MYYHCKYLRRNFVVVVTVSVLFQLMESIKDCFVTGKWQACEDAQALLEEDGRSLGLLLCKYTFCRKARYKEAVT